MRLRLISLVAALAVGLAACGSPASVDVRAGNAAPVRKSTNDPAVTTTVPQDTIPVDTQPDQPDETDEPDQTDQPDQTVDTVDTEPATTDLPTDSGPVFRIDPDKPAAPYDRFVEGAVNDIQRFWRSEFDQIYGEAFSELRGGIYPVWPGRTDLPGGCGMDRVTYVDVQGNAFYCGEGDFIAYDDDDLFPTIDREIGRFALGVALAHEFGHAIQARAGVDGPTIELEQQADCFAGAWVRYVADGNSIYVEFNDDDLNVSMNGLIAVRDEPGEVSESPNAHGSAFDRVGAFQEGWFKGAARCRDLLTDPLPSTLLPFTEGDFTTGGNAPYADIVDLLKNGLDTVWIARLTEDRISFTPPAIDVGADDTAGRCSDVPANALRTALYCPSTDTIVASDDRLRQLYDTFGDNAVGILIASAYSEAVQRALGSDLEGEPRELMNDCLTGTWTAELFPRAGASQDVTISAGDLDEAIQTLIAIGDPKPETDERGSPFEKIDSFRTGVLDGLDACTAKLAG